MKIDEYTIRVSARKISTESELEIGSDVQLILQGEVVKVEDATNFNGTISRCFVVRGILVEKS